MTPRADDLTRLKDMLRRKSVRFGDFTLASGAKSDVYVDCKPTTCDPHAMPVIGRLFLRRFEEKGWKPEAIGGPTIGAEPLAFAIARESLETGTPLYAFIVRKERKAHGMQKIVEGLEPLEGRKVVILEDVCTTGESTAVAMENAQSVGLKILGAMCLLDREMGAASLLQSRFGCQLESIFKLADFRS